MMPPMGRRKGLALTRQDVVLAGVEVVRSEGEDALGVSRVARQLGIKPPSIYNHVGSGDALAVAVAIHAYRECLGVLEVSVQEVVEPRERLLTLAHTVRRWSIENPGLYRLMYRFEPDHADPEYLAAASSVLDLFGQPMAEIGVGTESLIHALRSLRSAIHGFLLLETTGQFQLSQDRADSFDWMIRALIRGLGDAT